MINTGFGLHPEMTTNLMMAMVVVAVVAVTLNTIMAIPTKVLMT
jgi:hypothetical protein